MNRAVPVMEVREDRERRTLASGRVPTQGTGAGRLVVAGKVQ